MSELAFTTDPAFLAEVNRLAAERAADPRTTDERAADDLLDGIVLAVTTRVRAMLAQDMARIRPALVAGLAAGVNVPLLSSYCIRDAFGPDDENTPATTDGASQ